MLKEFGRHDDITFLSGNFKEIGAQRLEQQVEHVYNTDSKRQYPKRLNGIVWHNSVVYVHDEQGVGEYENIDNDRSDNDIARTNALHFF